MSRIEYTLTDEELAAACEPVEDGTNIIIDVFRLLLREEGTTWEEQDSINPTEYAIPEDQWKEIANALTKNYGIEAALTWMNVGPSSF